MTIGTLGNSYTTKIAPDTIEEKHYRNNIKALAAEKELLESTETPLNVTLIKAMKDCFMRSPYSHERLSMGSFSEYDTIKVTFKDINQSIELERETYTRDSDVIDNNRNTAFVDSTAEQICMLMAQHGIPKKVEYGYVFDDGYGNSTDFGSTIIKEDVLFAMLDEALEKGHPELWEKHQWDYVKIWKELLSLKRWFIETLNTFTEYDSLSGQLWSKIYDTEMILISRWRNNTILKKKAEMKWVIGNPEYYDAPSTIDQICIYIAKNGLPDSISYKVHDHNDRHAWETWEDNQNYEIDMNITYPFQRREATINQLVKEKYWENATVEEIGKKLLEEEQSHISH